MDQLLLHLLGDYITQTDWMAQNKTKNAWAAVLHAVVYTIPFILLTSDPFALFLICGSHFWIDHCRLVRYVLYFKNKIGNWNNPTYFWENCKATGYPSENPAWLSVWLMIIADNFLHLTINYFALLEVPKDWAL